MPLPSLFPGPREIVHFDDTIRVTGDPVRARRGDLPAQGYELTVDGSGVHLTFADDAGRRYGEQTLEQLRRSDGSFPDVSIRDWPDFVHRGYMLDVSRDRVPTRATLERLVERLAVCRYNQFQLYVEHTFAYVGHRDVWADASPLTSEDMVWLDGLCAKSGIELVTNQNTFGHFGRWLSQDAYRWRAECPDGFDIVPGIPMPPSVLAPNADNAHFVLDLIHEQMTSVTSRTVNIGCDETFELGRGVSGPAVAAQGRVPVYTEHLRRIVDPLVAEGLGVQFWGDVIRSEPGLLADLPDACTPLVWSYDAPDVARPDIPVALARILASIGIELDAPTDFTTILEPFVTSNHQFWVAPGTSTWQSFVGRLPNARANLLDAARAGLAAGAGGCLVTDWGDSGHHQPPSVSLAPVAYGGAVTWCVESNADLDVAGTVDQFLVGDNHGVLGGVLEAIGAVTDATGVLVANASPLFQAVVPSVADLRSGDADLDAVRAVITTLDEARDELRRARPSSSDGTRISNELDVAIRLAHHGALIMADHAGGDRFEPADAARQMADLIDAYRASWLDSSRPGGLVDSLAPLEACRARHLADAS